MTKYNASMFKDCFDALDNKQPFLIVKMKDPAVRILGQTHQMDAGELATQWVAYSHNKNSCEVQLDTLEAFERERLNKINKSKMPIRKKTPVSRLRDSYSLPPVIDDDVSEDLIDAYSTSNTSGKKRQLTPEGRTSSKHYSNEGTPKSTRSAPYTPRSFSPVASPSSREYGKRKNAGDVVCQFGASETTRWRSRSSAVKIRDLGGMSEMTQPFKYMFQKLMEKAFVLDDEIETMAKQLRDHHSLSELAHVSLPVQETVTVVGRLCCDSDGKLNAKSVMLEGSRETSGGRHIQLDLSAIERYSLFPGQIVALDGTNSTGRTFVATKLYQGMSLPLAKSDENSEEGALSVVVAAGPFTTSDCLSYEPLEDLMKYLSRETPDVCILIGPFVDGRHADIEKLPMTYDDFFITIIAKIADCTKSLLMELVVLPSQWDIHHDPIFPQSPFQFGSILERKIHFMSDPCTLNINGVVFGVTSTDVLLHLGKEEISCRVGGDRLGRLAQHLLTQHSYYPLYPADDEVNVDYELLEQFGSLPVTPNILILPSDLCYFVKDVTGCCCVNPGRLAKGKVAGTFSRLVVNRTGLATSVSDIAAQVVKI